MPRFLFVRHGESIANASGRISTAPPGPPLSLRGQEQSRELARRTAGLNISAVYSSPMPRAVRTAEEMAKVHGVPVIVSDDLVELHVGQAEGMPVDEGMRLIDEGWRRWTDNARYDEPVAPGGESAISAIRRIRRFLREASASYPGEQRVVAVTHGGLLHLTCSICRNLPFDYGIRNWLRNTEVAEIADDGDEWQCNLWGGLPVEPDRVEKVAIDLSHISIVS